MTDFVVPAEPPREVPNEKVHDNHWVVPSDKPLDQKDVLE